MSRVQSLLVGVIMSVSVCSVTVADSQSGKLLPRFCDRPIAVSVSPERTTIAIADQFSGRIIVADFWGRILWATACADAGLHPQAVCMMSEGELLFISQEHRILYRVVRQSSSDCDSLCEVSRAFNDKSAPEIVSQMPDKALLLFDKSSGNLSLFYPEQDSLAPFSAKVSGRATSVALSPSRRIVIAARGHKPLQVFSSNGDFIVAPGWSASPSEQNWEAGPVAVDIRERIWAADITRRQIRIFDMAGAEVGSVAFPEGLDRPIAIACAADAAVIIVFDNGSVIRYEDFSNK